MKRILTLGLMLVLIVSVSGMCFAQIGAKKAELAKVSKYIKSLDTKIIRARNARQINKLAELKQLKRDALSRAKRLKDEVARLEAAEVAPAPVPAPVRPVAAPVPEVAPEPAPPRAVVAEVRRERGLLASAGYGGGAGLISAGYSIPIRNFDLVVNAGFGMGNEYSIITAGIATVMPFGDNHAGLEVGVANYSEKVADIPGAGTLEKGSNTGVGLFAGRKIGRIQARIGYNTALGLTAGAIYRF